jgi:hypothetical protein
MVRDISSTQLNTTQFDPSQQKRSSLSEDQKTSIAEILSQYDGENLTQSDAQSIVESFKELGVEPSAALAEVMQESGFNAQEVGELAGVQNQRAQHMPPPPPSQAEQESLTELLNALMGDDSSDDESDVFSQVLNYTSKILNLNEESKEEVTNLLEKYSGENLEYTQEETSQILMHELNTILSDQRNYNQILFYA